LVRPERLTVPTSSTTATTASPKSAALDLGLVLELAVTPDPRGP
jgi:hypothetical protein